MCYYTEVPRFHMSERRKTYEMRLPCRYIFRSSNTTFPFGFVM